MQIIDFIFTNCSHFKGRRRLHMTLALIGHAISEKNIFENGGQGRVMDGRQKMPTL